VYVDFCARRGTVMPHAPVASAWLSRSPGGHAYIPAMGEPQPNPWLRAIGLLGILTGLAAGLRGAFGDTVGFTAFWILLVLACLWHGSARVRAAVQRLAARVGLI
jgi:hypothetical protein